MVDAGWYEDPYDTTKQRYWDGAEWTEQTLGGLSNAPPPTPKAPDATDKKWTPAGVVVLVVFVVLVAWGCNALGKSADKTGKQTAALAACQVEVEGLLKSPGSADFPPDGGSPTKISDTEYTFSSYVDSDNSFGASIRNSWSCTATYDGSSWNGEATLTSSN